MANQYYYGTGRRKSSVARVYLKPGNGTITINQKDIDAYFGTEILKMIVRQPFAVTETEGKFDVMVNVYRAVVIPARPARSVTAFPEPFWKWTTRCAAR